LSSNKNILLTINLKWKKIIPLVAGLLISSIGCSKWTKIDFRDQNNTIDYGTVSRDNDNGVRSFVLQIPVMPHWLYHPFKQRQTLLSKQNDTILPGNSKNRHQI
jgi:hypothetical protein